MSRCTNANKPVNLFARGKARHAGEDGNSVSKRGATSGLDFAKYENQRNHGQCDVGQEDEDIQVSHHCCLPVHHGIQQSKSARGWRGKGGWLASWQKVFHGGEKLLELRVQGAQMLAKA